MRFAAFFAALVLTAATSSSSAAVIGFDDLRGPNNSAFFFHAEDGFLVFPAGGAEWYINTIYGAPAPSVMFNRLANQPDVNATMGVRAVGDLDFTFSAIDLYSSVTRIPYRFIGFNNAVQMFDFSATMGNTFGSFRTASNPFADVTIDLLFIDLINPFVALGGNPMGLDNIVVSLSNAVPEPGSLALALLVVGAIVMRGSIGSRKGAR